ncbi:helix-turn-helix transcriptional regulator [Nonomuraea sp. B10E15]|uniref:helix-turn-helix domain-containing protein n=1 Tax=Nonomuraea sp. B10E15 TaxID=3153560 RepID=UPI00325D57F5
MTTTPPPPPATGETAFMHELRRLKAWSGLSFRELARRASAAGDALPSSTASTMLGRNRLPRHEVLVAFVRACGLDEEQVRAWADARAGIAAGTPEPAPASAPAPAPEAVPVRRTRAWRRRVLAGAAALGVILAGGAALTLGSESVETYETTVVR